jgi:predicted DNA-binding transcriptional regulator YafY
MQKGGISSMSANERRKEIIRILIFSKKITVPLLALRFGVSEKTIRRDLKELILEYPIKSVSGNGGGICFEDWFHPYRNILSLEEIDAIEMARDFFDEPYKSKF